MKSILLALLLLIGSTTLSLAQQAMPIDTPYPEVKEYLKKNHGEVPCAEGTFAQTWSVVWFCNSRTGTWTHIAINSVDGKVFAMGSGENWNVLPGAERPTY